VDKKKRVKKPYKARQILTYIGEDEEFQNPEALNIVGEPGGDTPDLDKLDPNPVTSGIPFLALQQEPNPLPPPAPPIITISQDWRVWMFPYNVWVRGFMTNTKTYPAGQPSQETRFSLIEVPRNPYSFFSVLSRNILLTVGGGVGLDANPHGMLMVKGCLATVSFDEEGIYFIKPNELNGLPEGTDYIIDDEAYFDLQQAIVNAGGTPLPDNAHAQAMYMASNGVVTYIYITYIVYTLDAEGVPEYTDSIVVRLRVRKKLSQHGYPRLKYVEQATTGLNTVSMTLATDVNGDPILLMLSIGGPQKSGATNGYLSEITSLPAFELWTTESDAMPDAKILLTGDPEGTAGSYDFLAITIAYRGKKRDKIQILAVKHHGNTPGDGEYTQVDYNIYETTSEYLSGLEGTKLSDAILEDEFESIDSGLNDPRGPLWDVATEMGTSSGGDRRITLKGGAVEFAAVEGYNRADPDTFVTYERGYGPGTIGCMEVNYFVLTGQSIEDAEQGFQFKRVLQGTMPEALRAAAQAARAAKIAAAKPGLRAAPRAAAPAEPETPDEEEEKK
jgi:hypothetical protein